MVAEKRRTGARNPVRLYPFVKILEACIDHRKHTLKGCLCADADIASCGADINFGFANHRWFSFVILKGFERESRQTSSTPRTAPCMLRVRAARRDPNPALTNGSDSDRV